MKALAILNLIKNNDIKVSGVLKDDIFKAIEELKYIQKDLARLEEYVQFARHHIETYRCRCGALGRVGYLCSNEECTEE